MLTKEEQQFLDYWSVQRTKKHNVSFTIGFPFAVLVVLGIFVSIITGWHKEATMVLRSDSSTILVILVAAIAIVVFITLFSVRYQREQHEQRYKELLVKKAADEKTTHSNETHE